MQGIIVIVCALIFIWFVDLCIDWTIDAITRANRK